jgi:outer membrane protein TolC
MTAGPVSVSLEQALRMAESQSEVLDVARAGITRATGQRYQARSQYMPQLNGSAGYVKTLRSQFQGLAGQATVDTTVAPSPPALCAPTIPENATPEQRAAALAQATTCPAASSLDFSSVGFGAKNQWTWALQLSQNLYTGGRVHAQTRATNAQLHSAEIEVGAQRAQLALDVTTAYYDAVLADQLVAIADSTLAQTESILREVRLARQVGNQSEYDLLRAQVTHDNQRPLLIQQQTMRDVAYLRLKQLLNVPLERPLALTTRIAGISEIELPAIASSFASDTAVSDRAPVRQMELAVLAQESQVKVARAERLPSLAFISSYQRLYFPNNTFNFGPGRANWTVGISSTFAIFTGGRIHGDELIAQAGLDQARAQLGQTRELAALDSHIALDNLSQAEAAWRASQGTAQQAQRAYSIDEVRYREGISTQTDLTQSRLLLEQAEANRARATRDLAVARMRVAMLRDLPLQSTTQSAAGAASQVQQQQQQQQQQRATQQTSGSQAGSTGGIQP